MTIDKTTREIVNEIIAIFEPVYKFWKENKNTEDERVSSSGNKTFKDYLVSDISQIGLTVGNLDNSGRKQEMIFVADIIEYIRSYNTKPDIYISEEDQVKITEEAYKRSMSISADFMTSSSGKSHDIKLPFSVKIASDYDSRNGTTLSKRLKEKFLELIDRFIVHDGNITGKEIYLLQSYQAMFNSSSH